jgi:hypothetical protein
MADALLSTKRSLLSALGTKYNDLYYSAANSSVSLVEATAGWQNIISIPGGNFGVTQQINIPIDQFIQSVVLHIQLSFNGTTTVPTDFACASGWGYALLNYINFTFGASATTAITLSGPSLWAAISAQCDMKEKRNELFMQGGQAIFGTGFTSPNIIDAYITIPLPFSTACDKLPVDSTLLSNNIVVTFAFNQLSSIAPKGYSSNTVAFSACECMLRQIKLSSQEMSIRQSMIAMPSLMYSYPFIHYQHYQPAVVGPTSSTYQQNTFLLNAFTNGDLLGIVLWFVDVTDLPGGGATGQVPAPFKIAQVNDIQVELNGVALFRLPAQSYRATNCLIGDQGNSSYDVVYPIGTAATYTQGQAGAYPIYLDFSRCRSACVQDEMFNTWRIPNQNLSVKFTDPVGSRTLQPYAMYMYNGVIEFQSGTSAVFIS